jgi:hypothetical protein
VSRGSEPQSLPQTNQRVIVFRPYPSFMERNLSSNSCACIALRIDQIDGYMQQRFVRLLSGWEDSHDKGTIDSCVKKEV